MKKISVYTLVLLCALSLSACYHTAFDGSRIGNESQLIMDYKVFHTTDSQTLELLAGDIVHFDVVSQSGSVDILLQKNEESPVYEGSAIPTSAFDVNIIDSGTYTVSVTGKNAAGSVHITKETPESATEESVQVTKEASDPAAGGNTSLLPGDLPQEFMFSSGAGGWRTFIILDSDGSFEGIFLDSEMGEMGDEYPNGSAYICEFTGQFDEIEQVNDYTYSMTLSEITPSALEGEEWIEDGVRYVASGPYGLEDGTEFLFYTPETPLEGLSEEFLMWWPNWSFEGDQTLDTLSCYGICNVEAQYGFFTYE